MNKYRPKGYKNPYTAELAIIPTQRGRTRVGEDETVYEAGFDAALEALEPLIRKIAPSSRLIDILYGDTDEKQIPLDLKKNINVCDCEFTPYTDSREKSWHYLRKCSCGYEWYGLHCPHDGYQNPCPHCNKKPTPIKEQE